MLAPGYYLLNPEEYSSLENKKFSICPAHTISYWLREGCMAESAQLRHASVKHNKKLLAAAKDAGARLNEGMLISLRGFRR